VVDADLRNYFDTIPHEPLLQRMATKVADGRVIKLDGMNLHRSEDLYLKIEFNLIQPVVP
jgi:RNA-directed DNA polymerase